MAGLLRGDVLYADLDPVVGHEQAGNRPILVISHDVLNRNSGTVIALAITSKEPRAGYPLSFPLPDSIGLPKKSWVKMNQVRTISVHRLGRRLAHLESDQLVPILAGFLELIE